MVITRTETLRRERDQILMNLLVNVGSRAKWLTALMDIDANDDA